ncbi:YbaN family protein [Pannonibacter sp. Pt2-lr]|uniref:YbaN family protein n=1 Tax=Pannonibacter anstelovis TaxID=3121537 RepID=A0ABU7ZHT2_9HYPH
MRRLAYRFAGIVCVILGVIGAILPVMPGTIFFILAAAMFAKSSPELEARILAHPSIGPQVIAWREHGVIPPRAKLYATGGMAFGYGMFWLGAHPGWPLALGVLAFMAACAAYVLSRPSYPRS